MHNTVLEFLSRIDTRDLQLSKNVDVVPLFSSVDASQEYLSLETAVARELLTTGAKICLDTEDEEAIEYGGSHLSKKIRVWHKKCYLCTRFSWEAVVFSHILSV